MSNDSILHVVDVASRCIWFASHFAGFVFILRCWRIERRDFYLWFAIAWLLMATRAVLSLTTRDVFWMHIFAGLVVSPTAAIVDFMGFRMLHRYLVARMSTIRVDADGNVRVRLFEKRKDAP